MLLQKIIALLPIDSIVGRVAAKVAETIENDVTDKVLVTTQGDFVGKVAV